MLRKVVNKLFLALVSGALFLGGGLTLCREYIAPKTWRFWENRTVQARPELSRESLWNGDYFTDLDVFYSDRFVGRDELISLDTRLDLLLGRPVIHQIVIGDGALLPFHGYLTWGTGYLAKDSQTMAERLAGLRDQAAAYGGRLYYVGVPQQYSYYQDKYPDDMDDRQWLLGQVHTQFAAALAGQDIPFVDMVRRFEELGSPDEFYAASDHHFAYPGALETYWTLMERVNADTGLDLPITTSDDLELIGLPNPFLGSHNRKLYGLWPTDEQLVVPRFKNPIPFTRADNGVEVAAEVYTLPADDQELVLYSTYMGGDVAETIIQTHRPELPRCLIWGDSYTNAVETVLWTSFDETRSLDLRHYNAQSLSDYIADYQPDIIICLRDDSAYLDMTGNGNIS